MNNEKKIAFIICTNDEQYYNECVKYLEYLSVPMGYDIDVLKIEGAKSMASGYNEGMHASDAKYKIYMHHDVFIWGKSFLEDMLRVFQSNEDIGLLGIVGTDNFVPNAEYWNAWTIGELYGCTGICSIMMHSEKTYNSEYAPAVAVDGMLMMTQYDVEWREDLFTQWDFYDISQSFEFRRRGYKVGVLLGDACTLHDCGHSKLDKYEEWRRVFCKEYAEFGFVEEANPLIDSNEANKVRREFVGKVEQLMQYDLESAGALIKKGYEIWPWDNTMILLSNIFEIYETEKETDCEKRFVEPGDDITSLKAKYTKYKFLLREIEYGIGEGALLSLYEDLISLKITIDALEVILLRCCYNCDGVEERIIGFIETQ